MTPEAESAEAFAEDARATLGNAGAPALQLGAWEGPLDLLLELARAQKVDLAQISIAALAEQFAATVEDAIAERKVPLARLAEWQVMAAWLTLLRTRLLFPDAAAQAEATGLRQRLAERDAVRRLADWLERRPQLGQEVFARGDPEPAAAAQPTTDLTALLRACLTVLEVPAQERVYRPSLPPLWRVPQALARMRRMLAEMPQGAAATTLETFLPDTERQGFSTRLQRRAALASTLVAALELSRDGAAAMEQALDFGEIRVATSPSG